MTWQEAGKLRYLGSHNSAKKRFWWHTHTHLALLVEDLVLCPAEDDCVDFCRHIDFVWCTYCLSIMTRPELMRNREKVLRRYVKLFRLSGYAPMYVSTGWAWAVTVLSQDTPFQPHLSSAGHWRLYQAIPACQAQSCCEEFPPAPAVGSLATCRWQQSERTQ